MISARYVVTIFKLKMFFFSSNLVENSNFLLSDILGEMYIYFVYLDDGLSDDNSFIFIS